MRRIHTIRTVVCLLAFSAVLQAQQYVFRAFRQAEGLKNLGVSALARDRGGFLWLATENGVYRFAGSGFERYGAEQGIAELMILDVIADPEGTIWVTTQGNLYRWDGRGFLPAGSEAIRTAGRHRVAVEDARHLLVVQKGHLYRLEHDVDGKMLSFLPVFPERMLASMPDLAKVHSLSLVREEAKGLRVWAGCGNSLCTWPDGLSGNPIPPREGVVTEWSAEQGLAVDFWTNVLLARDGVLWAAGQNHLAVLPAGAARFADRSIPGSDPKGLYGHAPLLEDREGRILAPADVGIARWDGSGWRIIGKSNGLESDSHIAGMVFDDADDLWLGSHGNGLYQWSGYANWEGWNDRQTLSSTNIWGIAPINADRVLVGTERGPAWINPRTGISGSLAVGRAWNFGQVGGMAVERDGSRVAGTASGTILHIDSSGSRVEETGRIPALIINAFEDSSGRLFLETTEGLFQRAPGERSSTPQRIPVVDALAGGPVHVSGGCESRGADWFLAGSRLLRFKDGLWSAPVIVGMPRRNESLAALACAKDGRLWLVDARGDTWRLTQDGDQWRTWQLDRPVELSTPNVWAVLEDRRGWLWLGTDLGLLAWNGLSWRHLTQESGLIWNDVNQGVMTEAPDGSLWIGTSSGVSHLLHPERVFDPIPLTVSLSEIRRGAVNYLGAGKITLPWAGAPLRFHLSSSMMLNRSELILKYRMMGLQAEWTETPDGLASFSRLDPGSYAFEAMACNPALNACSEPMRVEVRVLPPWWRTHSFYVVCVLAILLLLMAGDGLRARRLRVKSLQLEMLISERTRELEASREQLRIQATHDGLTGMLNRTAILRALTAELDRAQRENRTVVVALVDLDFFKHINDEYGHQAGDEALRWFAAAVGTAIRVYDHAGRYGGEEFLLVLTELPRDAAEQRLGSLHDVISNLWINANGVQFRMNCSMGATVFDPLREASSAEALLAIADQALYAAKETGRNRVVFRAAQRTRTRHSPIP